MDSRVVVNIPAMQKSEGPIYLVGKLKAQGVSLWLPQRTCTFTEMSLDAAGKGGELAEMLSKIKKRADSDEKPDCFYYIPVRNGLDPDQNSVFEGYNLPKALSITSRPQVSTPCSTRASSSASTSSECHASLWLFACSQATSTPGSSMRCHLRSEMLSPPRCKTAGYFTPLSRVHGAVSALCYQVQFSTCNVAEESHCEYPSGDQRPSPGPSGSGDVCVRTCTGKIFFDVPLLSLTFAWDRLALAHCSQRSSLSSCDDTLASSCTCARCRTYGARYKAFLLRSSRLLRWSASPR